MRDSVREKWMDERGWQFSYVESMPMKTLAPMFTNASLSQARVAAVIDDEVSETYGLQMANGDQFPPLILAKSPTALDGVDGHHRVAGALKAKLKTFDAYIVEIEAGADIASLRIASNTMESIRGLT